MIWSIFWYFFRKFRVFRFFLVCFKIVCFSCFAFIPKQRVSMFWLNQNKQKTNRNSLIESNFGIFFYLGVLFRFVWKHSVCFDCFDKGSKHRNNPKFLVFGFTKQTETKQKQILFRFVWVQTDILFCLFQDTLVPLIS